MTKCGRDLKFKIGRVKGRSASRLEKREAGRGGEGKTLASFFFFFNWGIVAVQCSVGFCGTMK